VGRQYRGTSHLVISEHTDLEITSNYYPGEVNIEDLSDPIQEFSIYRKK
jgi:hypothetical protein